MTTAVKERPILFSGPMVRAILDGRKTQTRRIVKGPYSDWEKFAFTGDFELDGKRIFQFDTRNVFHQMTCPYGVVGDRLWVRETWRPIISGMREGGFDYRADDPSASGDGFIAWKPSIHMPRVASRITLEITAVMVERLNDISAEDASAEGVMFGTGKPGQCRTCAKGAFMDLWNSINGVDSWLQNPWVWVVEFKRVKP